MRMTQSHLDKPSTNVTYRYLTQAKDFDPITDLETLIWQMDEREAVPGHMVQVIVQTGGQCVGAYVDNQMIGFAFALLANHDDGSQWLWSHMAAVHPDYQRQGVGFQLKQEQRKWALKQGYTRMGWTFDPLLRQNANFNLHHLGVMVRQYKVNRYGIMTDGLNAGFPSDRFIAEWLLDDERVHHHATGERIRHIANDDAPFLVERDENHYPNVTIDTVESSNQYRIEIPYDMLELKRTNRNLARAWQDAMAQVFPEIFTQGYRAIDFITKNDRCWYVVQKVS